MFSNLFNYENGFWRFMGRVGDLMILNVLFVICSLPLVTMGASLCAVYYTLIKIVEGSDEGTVKCFFRSFRQNLLQGSLFGIGTLLFGYALYVDYTLLRYISEGMDTGWRYGIWAFFGFVLILFFFVTAYVFPLQSRYYNPMSQTLKNAFILSFRRLPRTLLMLFTDGLCILIIVFGLAYVPQVSVLFLLLAVPLLALVNIYFLKDVLNVREEKEHPLPKEETKAEGENG